MPAYIGKVEKNIVFRYYMKGIFCIHNIFVYHKKKRDAGHNIKFRSIKKRFACNQKMYKRDVQFNNCNRNGRLGDLMRYEILLNTSN